MAIPTKLDALNFPARLHSFGVPKAQGAAVLVRMLRRRSWAFMHVPKTSGTAITQGLLKALDLRAEAKILTGFDRSLYGGFDRFDAFDPSVRTQIHLEDLPTGATAIVGHFAYSTLRRASRAAQVFTVFREPFCRLLSHWLFWRRHTDKELLPLGLWADCVREARRPLVEFLRSPTVACQTDNIVTRMLLWPHPLIPADDFINPVHDGQLIGEARARLDTFAHVDVFENPNLVGGLEAFIGRSIEYNRINEACAPPQEFSCDLDQHLTPEAWQLLAQRSRLDLCLWSDVVRRNLPKTSAPVARETAIENDIVRYQVLLQGRNGRQ